VVADADDQGLVCPGEKVGRIIGSLPPRSEDVELGEVLPLFRDDTITTTITAAGEYALVMPREEATTVTTAAITTPGETTTYATTETTGAPPTTPAASPVPLLCALGGIAAAGLLYRKRS